MMIPSHKRCADLAIRRLAPTRVRVPVAAMEPIVKVGEQVRAATLIARSSQASRWQLRRHSPLDGMVTGLETKDGNHEIVIEGEVPRRAHLEHPDLAALAPADIVALARDAGLVGMGGAMFPTYVKLSPETPLECVIINACESEPYICCDHRVLVEQRNEVEYGLDLAQRAGGARRGEIVTTGRGYPFGYERFVVKDVLGREVPAGGLLKDIGVVVINVQTAVALYRAACGEPLLDRVLTVDGDAVGRPGNYIVPIGTEVRYVLKECQVDLDNVAVLLGGGPMMGHNVDLDSPVTPGMGAILALSEAQSKTMVTGTCLRCGECMRACPLGLPAVLLSEQPNETVFQCIECGVCQFVCVGRLPLVQKLRAAKAWIRRQREAGP